MRTSRGSWRGAQHHERIVTRSRPSMATDRVFGVVVAGIFGVLAAVSYWRTEGSAWWLIAVAVVVAACAVGAPAALSPLNRGWIGLRQLASRVTSLVLLTAIYRLAFVPAG